QRPGGRGRRDAAEAGDARRGVRRLRFRRRLRARHPGKPRHVPQRGELAGPAGGPHLHPSARSGGSPADDDRFAAARDSLVRARDRAAGDLRSGHLHLVAEARMKQLRTLIILVVVLGGLLGYLYFVDAERPVGDIEEKPEVFDVEADDIEALRIRSRSGETTELTKTDGNWRITSPIEAPADASTVGSITSNLAALSIQRVVDENPTDLARYGLAEPTLEVAFKAK